MRKYSISLGKGVVKMAEILERSSEVRRLVYFAISAISFVLSLFGIASIIAALR